jgi:hypothetical protein
MNPLTYLAVLPGLFARRPKESADTSMGRSGLSGANDAYGEMRSQYGQLAGQSRDQLDSGGQDYLSYLRSPVGSDAQDAATLGRAREGIGMAARRSTARLANNPALVASGDLSGAAANIEQKRLAGEASLSNRVADLNLAKREQRQRAIIDYLTAQYSRNQGGLERALGAQRGIASQFLGTGRQEDGLARQDSLASAGGLMQLLAELGMQGKGNPQ